MKVNIPNPCSEKYDNMSPTEQGRMCKVCNTEVVDFTNWKTKDIIEYIQKSNKKVCGKLKSPNLNESYSFRRKNWLAVSASIIFFSSWNNLKAQYTNGELINKQQFLTDDFHLLTSKDSITLKFIDNKNRILPHVVVYDKNIKLPLHADSTGSLKIPINKNSFTLYEARFLGYVNKQINITPNQKNSVINVVLEEIMTEVGEIIIKPLKKINLKI